MRLHETKQSKNDAETFKFLNSKSQAPSFYHIIAKSTEPTKFHDIIARMSGKSMIFNINMNIFYIEKVLREIKRISIKHVEISIGLGTLAIKYIWPYS